LPQVDVLHEAMVGELRELVAIGNDRADQLRRAARRGKSTQAALPPPAPPNKGYRS
jgi:hypothetical protein